MSQHVLLVINARHEAAVAMAHQVIEGLHRAGMSVTMTDDDARSLHEIPHGVHVVPSGEQAGDGCQLVVVLGGDGTILRGAELARGGDVALLGINLGHVGFLAEAEPEDLTDVVRAIVEQDWEVESRLALDVTVFQDGKMVAKTWALNEISLEKSVRERMVEVLVEVDARPLSRWGCDGVVCVRPPPVQRRTRLALAGLWCGRKWKHLLWCRSAPMHFSPARWWYLHEARLRWNCMAKARLRCCGLTVAGAFPCRPRRALKCNVIISRCD